MIYRFGKQPRSDDKRTLQLPYYFDPAVSIPETWTWTTKVRHWGMHLNNQLGTCAIAAPDNQQECWRANAGRPITVSDQSTLTDYMAVSGYQPGDPSSDVGCNELDVLKRWRNIGINRRKIVAFGDVNPQHPMQVRQTIYFLGGAYLGMACPAWLVKLLRSGGDLPQVWDLTPGQAPDPDALHAIEGVAYTPGLLGIVTWDRFVWLTDRAAKRCLDEAHGMVSTDWLTRGKRTPHGLDMPALMADLKVVTA